MNEITDVIEATEGQEWILFAIFGFFALNYIISSILLASILKRADYANPWLAWVPVWNYVAFMQVGGVKRAWLQLLIIGFILPFVTGLFTSFDLPIIAGVVALCQLTLYFLVAFTAIRGIQYGFGFGNMFTAILGAIIAPYFTFLYLLFLFIMTGSGSFYLELLVQHSNSAFINRWANGNVREHFNSYQEAYRMRRSQVSRNRNFVENKPAYVAPDWRNTPAAPLVEKYRHEL